MAKTSLIAKAQRTPKFAVRKYTRCRRCGRPRAYLQFLAPHEDRFGGALGSAIVTFRAQ